ncbi:hypothetical protein B566_EDAN011533 [Ephemera danica]|nr:hypothetical protein B566_EDAN011533 [Ephemera danica]
MMIYVMEGANIVKCSVVLKPLLLCGACKNWYPDEPFSDVYRQHELELRAEKLKAYVKSRSLEEVQLLYDLVYKTDQDQAGVWIQQALLKNLKKPGPHHLTIPKEEQRKMLSRLRMSEDELYGLVKDDSKSKSILKPPSQRRVKRVRFHI